MAFVIPPEAYLFGRSAIWASFWLIVAGYLRNEARGLLRDLRKILARIVKVKVGGKSVEIVLTKEEEVPSLSDVVVDDLVKRRK